MTANEPELWATAARSHFSDEVAKEVRDRGSFETAATDFAALLWTERAAKPNSNISLMLQLARSAQPCPPNKAAGVELLVDCKSHVRLASIVRMDDGTEWVGELGEDESFTFYLLAIQLLALLCQKDDKVRKWARGIKDEDNGFMSIDGVLENHVLTFLPHLSVLRPQARADEDGDEAFCGFGSLDCRQLQAEDRVLKTIEATAAFYFCLYSDDKQYKYVPAEAATSMDVLSASRARMDRDAFAMELSGHWFTTTALGRGHGSNMVAKLGLTFDPSGTVEGQGKDGLGDFTISGFWTFKHVFMKKTRPNYSMDLLGFLADDFSFQGCWLMSLAGNMRAGGFGAFKGSPPSL